MASSYHQLKRNAISFCLFGSDPVYCHGAIRNAELIKTVYPGWEMRVYIGGDINFSMQDKLRSAGAACVESNCNPMIARFMVAEDPAVDRFLVRDTDSRLNARERMAVDEWIKSGRSFHVIRDHPGHCCPIGGGLWGGVAGKLPMSQLIAEWRGNKAQGTRNEIYNQDQLFLRDMVWPLVKDDCLQHDFCLRHVFRDAKPFPAKAGDYRFVGERFSADDNPCHDGWPRRLNWLEY